MSLFSNLLKETKSLSNPIHVKTLAWFFKTGKGDYGEGDKFLGLKVPVCRTVAKKYVDLDWPEITKLIQSKYHEERLIALLILVEKFSQANRPKKLPGGEAFRSINKSNEKEKAKIVKFYLAHTKWINNWDLVDLSAPKIIGPYLFSPPFQGGVGGGSTPPNLPLTKGRKDSLIYRKAEPSDKYPLLFKLVKSKNLWEKRIAIVSTWYLIREHEYQTTLDLSEILLSDNHDLIHKSVGWMLREVGKKSITSLTPFLKKHYKTMPRTMLRYAIEKFPEEIRQAYLKGSI